MNVQQLRYVVAVSDFGSVSAAARSLHVTQPVISRSIRSFEVEHGVTIFALSRRCLVPTEAGAVIVSAARDALAAFDLVGQKAREAGGQSELAIATTPTNGLLLTNALSDLGRDTPNLAIQVCRASGAVDVARRVEEGEAELGFSELNPAIDKHRLVTKPMGEEEVVLVSPIGTDLPMAVSWQDVAMQPLIMPSSTSDRRALIAGMTTSATGTAPHVSLVTEDRTAWVAAAEAGMGSFLSYRRVVERHGRVEIRPFDPPQTVSVGFLHRKDRISKVASRLVGLVQATYANLPHAAQPGPVSHDW
jgi:DNA-binding transcriptional LysR family regulator